jgi:hypothetical protein
MFRIRPDIRAWRNELAKKYDIREIFIFADFSNPSLRAEIPKIREVTNYIIETQNASARITKDFTDFIIDNPDPKPIPRHSLRGRLFADEEEDEKEASPVPGFFHKASPLFEADDEDEDLSAYTSGGYDGSAGRSHSQRLACASPAGMSFRMSSFSTAEEDEEDNVIPGFFRRLSAEEEDTDTEETEAEE